MSDPAKHALVVELFEKMGGQKMVEQSMNSTFDALRTIAGELPEEFWTELHASTAGDDTLAKAWADALERAFEPDELQILIDYYRAPPGQKMAAALPQLTGAVAGILLRWQQEVLMPRLTKLLGG